MINKGKNNSNSRLLVRLVFGLENKKIDNYLKLKKRPFISKLSILGPNSARNIA